ncbi:hypothetical protein [Mucilaginibacter gotjawali]|uniref:Uncharacterized protein n=2 Tax=Mucilaginibacter gotjawali TaxID=1550579 RepID=A0A839SAM9_9SPHI|nr:hypothetical protein [Mucilaginibacter gotjawali]MBB3054303.1 hypothetical protein [Mucilaginibacter gotjawali]BAU51861.1 hypothetical protein MgSA37_00010 [Mucilaginibacter gotjawali]
MIYNNVPQVIAANKATAALYPNVNAFLRNPDYACRQKKLEEATDLEAELFAEPTYNILNLLATVGLEGKVLLAVDTQKVDMLHVKEALIGQNNNDLYLSMARYLPRAVDGYLFSAATLLPNKALSSKN